jgi:hypothetical protein
MNSPEHAPKKTPRPSDFGRTSIEVDDGPLKQIEERLAAQDAEFAGLLERLSTWRGAFDVSDELGQLEELCAPQPRRSVMPTIALGRRC